MRKIYSILFFILLGALPIQVKADDASAVAYEHWSYGHIKADTPNKQIALEKELMIVTENSIQATFVFRNTTNQHVETPCVFPINVSMRMEPSVTEGDSIYSLFGQGSSKPHPWAIGLNTKVTLRPRENCSFSIAKHDFEAADKKLRKYTYEDYLKRVMELTGTSYLSGCDIHQNGQIVPIKNVGVETTTGGNDDIKGMNMNIYFYHFLKFKPYEVSKVVVEYPIESFELEYRGCKEYRVMYDISSGGTWKDNIKSFMVYSTLRMKSISKNPENVTFNNCAFSDWKIYYKKDYKPVADDYFLFEGGSCDSYLHNASGEQLKERRLDYLKNDSTVKIFAGPDELNPFASFPKKVKPLPYVTNVSSSTNQDISPLFDGNLYTSYVTPTSSYVEFTLTKPALGPFVSNGFVGNMFNEKVFYGIQAEKKRQLEEEDERLTGNHHERIVGDYDFPMFKDTVWENTSRLKKMTLQRIGASEKETFSLANKYGVLPNERDDWKGVNAVHHPKILRPGTYRLTFDETYNGKRREDVALSEIWFYQYPEDLIAMAEEEKKDSIQIFQDYDKYIERNWVTDYDFVPYELLRSQSGSYYKECLKKFCDDSLKLEMDSLGNYCIAAMEYESTAFETVCSDEMPNDSTAIQNTENESSDVSDAGKSYRIIIGIILALLIAGGAVLFILKRRGSSPLKKK